MSTTSSQETKGGATTPQTSKFSVDPATQGRLSRNTGLCLECGNPVSCPPGRGRPRSLCRSCRVKRCRECGSVFERVYRSDKKKDAGVFCSRGCFFVHRKKRIVINEESSSSSVIDEAREDKGHGGEAAGGG